MMGSTQSVMTVAFSPNDEFVLGASNDATVRLWSVQQGRVRVTTCNSYCDAHLIFSIP
jgi:WD40 repeat protein